MTDGQLFLLVFAAIYLSDCFAWTTPASTGFVSWWNRRWKTVRPSPLAGNDRGGVVFGAPFPPLGTCFLSGPWPLSITEEGISTLTIESPNPGRRLVQGERCIRWADLHSIQRDRTTLILNEERFVKLPGVATAHHWAEEIARLNKIAPEARGDEIRRGLRASLNPQRVGRKKALFLRATGFLGFCNNLLFILWFVLIPLSYIRFGPSMSFLIVLLEAFLLMTISAIAFLRLHRRLYPGLKGEGWQHFFLVLLAPQFTIRSRDALAHHFFRGHHVIAVSKALLEESRFNELANAYRRDLEHPIEWFPPEEETGGSRHIATDFHQNYLLPAVRTICNVAEELPEDEAPLRCPRCHVGYWEPATHCEDCGGKPLSAQD